MKVQLQTVEPACIYPFSCRMKKLLAKEKRLVCKNKSPCNQQSFDPDVIRPLDKVKFDAARQIVHEDNIHRSVEYAKVHPKKFTGLIVVSKKTHGKKKSLKSKKPVEEDELDKYITSGEQGELPITHLGREISRPLNAVRLAEYKKCIDCKAKPTVVIQYKTPKNARRYVGLCVRHWTALAPTVIGWSGE